MPAALCPPLLLTLLLAQDAPVYDDIPLDQAVQEGVIRLTGESLGGHSGGCLSLRLWNLSGRALRTTVPAGWLMRNSEPKEQDLMIVDQLFVELPPKGTRTVKCQAYCVESTDRSPTAGQAMLSMGPGKAPWEKLARHLLEKRVDGSNAQAAIWAVANNHDIAAIGAGDVKAHLELRRFVAELTGREVPWYGKTYAPPRGEGQVFSDAPTAVYGEVDFALSTHGTLSVLVHDHHGLLVKAIGKDRILGPGTYSMEMDISVQDWPKGDYTVEFRLDGSRLLKRLSFTV